MNKALEITFDEILSMSLAGTPIKRSSVFIRSINDNPNTKTVSVILDTNKNVVLWKGDAYDAIGNWTNEQVVTKTKEELLKLYK